MLTAALLALSAASAVSGISSAPQHRRRPQRAKAHPSPTRPTTSHPPIGDRTPTVTETRRILTRALVSGELPDADKAYLATVVFNRTGMSTGDSEKRLTDVFAQAKGARDEAATKAKEAADAARKIGVYAAPGPSCPC